MKSFYYTTCALLLLNSCSILVGQVKPVEEKAPTPQFAAIDQRHPDWKRLELHSATSVENPDDIPDSAWQSNKTAAVVSLTSACRKNNDGDMGLRDFTANLLSQWRNLNVDTQREIKVSNYPALETTAEGIYLNRLRKFQTVVVKSKSCMYELVYLSQTKTFSQEIAVFQEFRDSLNLK